MKYLLVFLILFSLGANSYAEEKTTNIFRQFGFRGNVKFILERYWDNKVQAKTQMPISTGNFTFAKDGTKLTMSYKPRGPAFTYYYHNRYDDFYREVSNASDSDKRGEILFLPNGRHSKMIGYDEQGNPVVTTTFYYDDAYNLIREVRRYNNGRFDEYKYEYDAQHNKIRDELSRDNYMLIHYNSNGYIESREHYVTRHSKEKPTLVRIDKYKTDKQGNWVEWTSYEQPDNQVVSYFAREITYYEE